MTQSQQQTIATPANGDPVWASDLIAEQLRTFGIPFISLTPGSTYRGLHDSIVNHLGNVAPEMVLSLHEEHAVSVAHGYAKVAEEPLLVGLHANVGLMHAVMAIYNAYCDRVPMLIIGANGPLDAAERRPWIDWLHSSADPGALVREFVRWDDQPASLDASLESLVRGFQATVSYPSAPAYICLDVAVQETQIEGRAQVLDPRRYPVAGDVMPAPETLDQIASLLREADAPLILAGRLSRNPDDWRRRVELAEAVSAKVATDLKVGSTFPTSHPLHVCPPTYMPSAKLRAVVREADVILSLDWIDLGGTIQAAFEDRDVAATVISCSADSVIHNGWTKDHFSLPVADINVAVKPDTLVRSLLQLCPSTSPRPVPGPARASTPLPAASSDAITMESLGRELRRAVGDHDVCLARVPLGWVAAEWEFEHPLDCLGADGGAGIGSGPGMTVGAALALRDDSRMAIGVLGDGDTLMGASALWTAASMNLPVLVIAANNGSFYNDEIHQQRVAQRRERPEENAWVGVRIDGPRPELAEHIRGLGVRTFGPVLTASELPTVLTEAIELARTEPVFVDVHVPRAAYKLD